MMKAYAVVDKNNNVVEVCGQRLAIYPLDDAAKEVVKHEAKAHANYDVAEVVIRVTKKIHERK